MYARTKVFQTFGFDKFISKDEMKYKGRGGGRFIDDQSAFDEVINQIDTHDKPVLAHLITMQNHMPYGGQYDDPINPNGLPPNYARLAGQYARGISRTDDALANMLAKLKKSPEPTAVIFYGDHLPPQVYPQSLVEREGLLTAHQTPFLIWSNRKPLAHTDLPTTSPIQFMPKLFNALKVPIPPWYALLDDLDKQIPAMDTGIMVNPQDKRVKASQLTPGGEEGALGLPDDHVRPEHREALQREDDVRRHSCQRGLSLSKLRRSRGTAPGSARAGGSPSASSGCPWARGSCRVESSVTSAASFSPDGGTNSGTSSASTPAVIRSSSSTRVSPPWRHWVSRERPSASTMRCRWSAASCRWSRSPNFMWNIHRSGSTAYGVRTPWVPRAPVRGRPT